MTGLEVEELALLRKEAEGWFTDTCDVWRTTLEDDPFSGSGTSAEAVVMEGIPCAIESGAALQQLEVIASKVQGVQLFTVTLPAGTSVEVDDHLVIPTRNDLHLRIQAVIGPESWEIERRVIASELGEHNA